MTTTDAGFRPYTWQDHPLPPPTPVPGHEPPPRRKGGVLASALAVAALLAASLVGVVVVGQRDDYPDKWDPRAVDLVAFVERERGLTFKHPVSIDFLNDEAFRKEVTEVEALDEKEEAELTRAQAMLRAVGLMSGEIDLMEAGKELAGDGIVGLYDIDKERIVVRGDTFDDERRMTLVHELTHALQDQSFDIGKYRDRELTSGEDTAYTAVLEADATKVADAWRETLPAASKEALDAAEEKSADGDDASDFKGVPPVFGELMAFPYVFGPDFLQAVVDKEGALGRNKIFTEPPTTEEHLLLPETYLSRQPAQQVKVPELAAGETAVEDSEGDVGMLSLLVMLAERIDFGVAYPAVQGWAGDSIVVFERAGTTCVRSDVLLDTAAQAERFGSAIAQWGKDKGAISTRNDRTVRFESCDPGAAAAGGRAEGHVSGIQGLALRKGSIAEAQAGGVPQKAATCIVDGLFERVGADKLAKLDQGATSDPRNPTVREMRRVAAELASGCL